MSNYMLSLQREDNLPIMCLGGSTVHTISKAQLVILSGCLKVKPVLVKDEAQSLYGPLNIVSQQSPLTVPCSVRRGLKCLRAWWFVCRRKTM